MNGEVGRTRDSCDKLVAVVEDVFVNLEAEPVREGEK